LEPRCLPTENALYPFSLCALTGLCPSQRGEYTHPPHIEFRSPLGTLCIFSVELLVSSLQSLSSLLATHPKNALVNPFLATLPKTQVLKVLCLRHMQKLAGVGGFLLLTRLQESAERARRAVPRSRTCTWRCFMRIGAKGDLYLAVFHDSLARTRFGARRGRFSSRPPTLTKTLIYNNLVPQNSVYPGESRFGTRMFVRQNACTPTASSPMPGVEHLSYPNRHSRSMVFSTDLFYTYLALEFTTISKMRRNKSLVGAFFSQNSGKAEAEQHSANREDSLGSRGPTKWLKR
jgi:hypothetical protein